MEERTMKNNWLPGRSYWILLKKFHIYLFPAMLAIVALTVNEFVDGMLVANLIGSHAMAVVSLGYPILFIIATLYTLIGTGGGTLYALFLGEHKAEKAAKVCYLSLWASFLSGLLLMFIGLAFVDAIMPLLCPDEELMGAPFTLWVMLVPAGVAEIYQVTAAEELAIYTSQHQKQGKPLDVLLRLHEDKVEIDYRSLGEVSNPTEYSEKDNLVNLCLLQKLASQITYDYIMGMNSTHIVLDTKRS